MSREEAQSEMQKFKGEALARNVEKRTKLLAQAKSRIGLVVRLIMGLLVSGAFYALRLLKMSFALPDELLPVFVFVFMILLITGSAEAHKINRRIDALIELIGEENLLKKS